jgi:hypothetical protein
MYKVLIRPVITYAIINPLNAKINLICNLLALLGAHHILHISRIRVNIGQNYTQNHSVLQSARLLNTEINTQYWFI